MRMAFGWLYGRAARSRHETSRDTESVNSRILILDFGAQYTQLIARRVREAHVYSEIHPSTRSIEWIRDWNPTGIIFSGGPNSVYAENAPVADRALLDVAPI